MFLFILSAVCAQAQAVTDSNGVGFVRINADYRLDELLDRYKEMNEGKQIQGYRVQLFSGDRKGAFDLKAGFISQFPKLPCNVIYEAPDFKVLVGNYRTQMEAERALQDIRPVFKAAFVVPALIDLPQLTVFSGQ
jgi:hypothetical protein